MEEDTASGCLACSRRSEPSICKEQAIMGSPPSCRASIGT